MTSIGRGAFENCKSLSTLIIPWSVTTIGNSAFKGCTGLKTLNIPYSVTGINASAFADCTGLSELSLPSSLKYWGSSVFANCTSLTSVINLSRIPQDTYSSFYNVDLSKIVLSVLESSISAYKQKDCWKDFGSIVAYTPPTSGTCGDNIRWTVSKEGTLSISGTGAMYENTMYYEDGTMTSTAPWYPLRHNITSINISEGITNIPDFAFMGCDSLLSINIAETVTRIGDFAFYYCPSLTSCAIPVKVNYLGASCFAYCYKLSQVSIGDKVEEIGNRAFYNCSSLCSFDIPSSLNVIEEETFENCSSLEEVFVPSSVKTIEKKAFYCCSNLSTVTFCDGISSIGEEAFYDCRKLKYLSMPNTLENIGKSAFLDCESLSSVTLGNSVSSIDLYAFCYCKNIKVFTNLSTYPQSISEDVFEYIDLTNVTLRVPEKSIKAYKANSVWKLFGAIEAYVPTSGYCGKNLTWNLSPDSTLTISGTGDMYDFGDSENDPDDAPWKNLASSIKRIAIEEGVTSIGYSAFVGACADSVSISNSVTYIGDIAFRMCKELKDVKIPNSVNYMGEMVFYGCSNLVNVVLSDSITRIDDSAFAYCPLIKSISIPENVTIIGDDAFRGCTSLTDVRFPCSLQRIDEGAFAGCESLAVIECRAIEPPVLDRGGDIKVFDGVDVYNVILKVPAESVDAYKKADIWRSFGRIEPLAEEPSKDPDLNTDTDISSLANAIYVNESEAHAGESIVLAVKMKNSVEVSGLQCNVYLPEGMEVTKVARGQRLKARDDDDEYIFSFDNSVYEDGSRFILAYTSKDAVVEGNDGEIATITLNIPETMEPGDYPIIIKNTELSKDGSSTEVKYVKSTLRIVDYKLGDANGDDKLSVADLTSIASHLLGRTPDNFVPKAADANNDGKVSVSDITAIARMLLDGGNARVRTLFTESVE